MSQKNIFFIRAFLKVRFKMVHLKYCVSPSISFWRPCQHFTLIRLTVIDKVVMVGSKSKLSNPILEINDYWLDRTVVESSISDDKFNPFEESRNKERMWHDKFSTFSRLGPLRKWSNLITIAFKILFVWSLSIDTYQFNNI